MGETKVPKLPGTAMLLAAQPPGLAMVALPNLDRVRWLMPQTGQVQNKSLQLFHSPSLKSRIWRFLVRTKVLPGEQVWLRSDALDSCLAELAQILGENDVSIAISCGTEGAYRKHTMGVLNHAGTALAYVKMPASTLAVEAIRTEEASLRLLSGIAEMAGQVPEVLGTVHFEDRPGLVLSPGPLEAGPRRLGHQHLNFLLRLHGSTTEVLPFTSSKMWRHMDQAFSGLRSTLSDKWTRRFSSALALLHTRLGLITMPCGMAHRDFAPWNIKLGPTGLYVFDWEAARECSVPVYDAFHFDAIRAALRGAAYEPGSFAQRLLEECWPDGRAHLLSLYLAYLVDMSLFYAKARVDAPHLGDGQVFTWFGAQIDRFLGV